MALHVISLGGSLIVPDKIDINFLETFKSLIEKRIKKGDKFILVTGGGKTARNYQEASTKICKLNNEEKDWLGIHATRLNAHLIKTIFLKDANPIIMKDFDHKAPDFNKNILVAAGWKPGFSTDFIAVKLAIMYNADSILNLSNIKYVYSSDPKKNPNAKKFTNMNWEQLQNIVGTKWDPGLSMPFDPIATKLANENNMKVVIINGKNLVNVENYLEGDNFEGTTIQNT